MFSASQDQCVLVCHHYFSPQERPGSTAMRLFFQHFTNLEITSVVIDIVGLPPVIDSLAGEATVTETVGGCQDPELVDESPATLVGGRTLWREEYIVDISIYWTGLTIESNVGVPGGVSSVTAANNPDKNNH